MNIPAIPGFIGKRVDQLAFVVTDLEASQRSFDSLYGPRTWNVWENLARGQINKQYYGGPGDYEFSCGYAYIDDLQIEICRHDGGRSVYKDWLDTRGPGLHHVAYRLDTRDEYDAASSAFEQRGAPLAMGGEIEGTGVWAYFDTVAQLGCYTELYWSEPWVFEIFERMKRGELVDLQR